MIHKVIVPDSRRVNLSFNVPPSYVGEQMQIIAFINKDDKKQLISIEESLYSPAIEGKMLSHQEFRNWIHEAETTSTQSLHEARNKWTSKRKQLQQLTK